MMDGITDKDLLKNLMSSKGRKRKADPKKWALIRTENGLEKVALTKSITETVGSYQGNVGSQRRSRKGRTYRAPNGSRYYVSPTVEVVAYKV